MQEDQTNGLQINLTATDAELNEPLEIFITELPRKGKLYMFDGAADAPAEQLIDRPYSPFDLGAVYGQYLHNVTAISSFYTFPPSMEHSPLTLLGPPGCDTYGECMSTAPPWETDFSIDPPIGTRLYVHPYNKSWGETGLAR
eukprot:7383236-Prymnesium_polylepis.1